MKRIFLIFFLFALAQLAFGQKALVSGAMLPMSVYNPTLANCSNTTGETDVISFTIAANTWADGDIVRLVVPVIKHKQNQGGAVNFTLKAYVAGTSKTIVSSASIANNASEGRTSFEIFFARVGTSVYMLQGLDNSGSLNYQANAPMSARYFNSGADFSSDAYTASANNEYTSVTFSSSVVIKLSVTFGTASSSTYYNVQSAKAFKIGGTAITGGLIGATGGGTGIASYTTGDILYSSATDVLSKLAIGSTNKALIVTGGIPAWGTVAVAGGGTGAATLTNHGVLLGQGTSAVVATSAGTAGQYLVSGGASADPSWVGANVTQTTSATPTGTSNTTGLMQGLAASITTGASTSGIVQIIVSGAVTSSAASNGWKYQIRYGTGSAPANAAALTGTAIGLLTTGTLGTGANRAIMPFCIVARVTGLSASTTYWIDLSLGAVTGGTATMTDVCINAEEK